MTTQSCLAERILFHRLEHEEISREDWKQFITAHCHQIYIGPWFPCGSMTTIRQLQLWNRGAEYGIILSARPFDPGYPSVAETMLHELIHMMFYVVGMKKHKEASVERVGRILEAKYPYILDVFREVYPGLTFSEQDLVRAFDHPATFWLPITSP